MKKLFGRRDVRAYGGLTAIVLVLFATGLVAAFVVSDPVTGARVGSSNVDALGPPSRPGADSPTAGDAAAGGSTTSTSLATTIGGGGPAAAPTSSAPPPGAGGGAAAPAGGNGGATDIGVTADTIRLGILLSDVSAASDAGIDIPGFSEEEQRLQWDTFVEGFNASGGAHGRKLEPVYRLVDSLDTNDMFAACQAMAEDEKVFAVATVFAVYADPVLCFTERFGIPLYTGDGPSGEQYRRSNRLLFGHFYMGKSRALINTTLELNGRSFFDGRTLGVLAADFPGDREAVTEDFLPLLEEIGHKPAHVSMLSSDAGTAQSQIPVEVQEMQQAGVDTIVLATNVVYASQFINQADSALYRPLYVGTDFASITQDLFASLTPESFEAVAYTAIRTGEARAGMPAPAYDETCMDRYEARNGVHPSWTDADSGYQPIGVVCSAIDRIGAALRNTGPTLTRPGLTQATQNLGTFPMAFSPEGSWTPGKFDSADFIRPLQIDRACRCWTPVGDFVRAKR